MNLFNDKEDVEYVTKRIYKYKIAEEGYNLSVSSYVDKKDTKEVIDIDALGA